jgi:membrane-associated phospholipid phosphatase
VALPSRRESLRALMRPVDLATISYLLLIAALVVLFHHNVADWGWYVVKHCAAALAIVGLIRAAGNRRDWIGILRHWYPVAVFPPLFTEMNQLVTMIFPFWANSWLIRLDHALFGVNPTVWFERVATPALTELMVIFYLAYFLLIPAAALPLYLRRKQRAFDCLMFNTALAFYLSFVAFLIFPAVSPRVTMAHLQSGPLEGGMLLSLLNRVQSFGGIRGGAFPSSHVAVAFAILLSAHRHERKVFYVLLPFVLGLAVSTTYCRYHYAVDAIAGALLGLFAVVLGQRLFARWERARFSPGRGIAAPKGVTISPHPVAETLPLIGEKRRHHAGGAGSQTAGVRQEIE